MSAFEQCRKSLTFALKRRSEKEHLLTKTLEDTESKNTDYFVKFLCIRKIYF